MCSEASRRSQESSTTKEAAQDLSAAVVLFLQRYPGSNAEEFTSEVRSGATREAVRSIVDETMRIRIEWGHKSLSEIGDEVVAVMRQRHPELSSAALEKLGNYFTYLVR